MCFYTDITRHLRRRIEYKKNWYLNSHLLKPLLSFFLSLNICGKSSSKIVKCFSSRNIYTRRSIQIHSLVISYGSDMCCKNECFLFFRLHIDQQQTCYVQFSCRIGMCKCILIFSTVLTLLLTNEDDDDDEFII